MSDHPPLASATSTPENPFVVESPERLTPEQIVSLFIPNFTRIGTVRQRKHTFVWGSRGSGKSMIFRYLEPQCQSIVHGSVENYLKEEAFLGLYCPCKEGQLNKTELGLLSKNALQTITEHMINLIIAERLVSCLLMQFPRNFFPREECERFTREVIDLFDSASIASSLEFVRTKTQLYDEPLKSLQALFANENRKISSFLRSISLLSSVPSYDGATSGYHDFLLPMLRSLRVFNQLGSIPVFILLDDADRLKQDQQSIINSWIANRDQQTVCLKISAQHEEYRTFFTRDGALIEQPHDYSEITVDELYTRNKSEYAEKVRLIADKRLQLSSVKGKNVETFLPPDPNEEKLLEEVKRETAEEWTHVDRPGRKQDYVTRYAIPRLFQLLRKKKMRKSYAGFQNLVHLSSGVVRDFLEPCYLMFEDSVAREKDPATTGFIEPGIQNDVVYRYSEELLIEKFEDIRQHLPPESWSTLDSLGTLVESMGRLLYERLHDPKSREARLFSFTLRGAVPHDIEEILRMGVRYRYFQVRTYSTKEGGGRERWYILNRRLCPIYKLDPTGFEGRVSLTPELLEVACKDPNEFVRLRLKEGEQEEDQPTLVSFGEAE